MDRCSGKMRRRSWGYRDEHSQNRNLLWGFKPVVNRRLLHCSSFLRIRCGFRFCWLGAGNRHWLRLACADVQLSGPSSATCSVNLDSQFETLDRLLDIAVVLAQLENEGLDIHGSSLCAQGGYPV